MTKDKTLSLHISAHEVFWMVTDPLSDNSVVSDVFGKSTLASIGRQVLGGLNIDQENLTLYFGPDAETDARKDADARIARKRGGVR